MEMTSIPDSLLEVDPIQIRIDKFELIKEVRTNDRDPFTSIMWCYPKYHNVNLLPTQGFKIHLSATILNSCEIFDLVIPFLISKEIQFKVLGSNKELRLLNSNFYGYQQVGKFITVYPLNAVHANQLIFQLEQLTRGFKSPRIPSDNRIYPDSIVHYRYGKIIPRTPHSTHQSEMLERPDGSLEEDLRDPTMPVPEWIEDPIEKFWKNNSDHKNQLFANRFIILKNLRQRAKGGVYLALDCKNLIINNSKEQSSQLVILKEARFLGEIEPSGIDAITRVKWQTQVQQRLAEHEISPKIYDQFIYEKNFYLVMEKYGNHSLRDALLQHHLWDSLDKVELVKNIVDLVNKMHTLGIYFFDLSPDNVRIGENNEIKFIDLEFAITENAPTFVGWNVGTPGFYPKQDILFRSGISESIWSKLRDIYAIGSILVALSCPKWFDELVNGVHFNHEHWGTEIYLGRVGQNIKKIVTRCQTVINQFEINELSQLISNLKAEDFYETSTYSE